MIDTFRKTAACIENDFVKNWKKQGKKVIGYGSVYVPEEIIHASGALPFRLRGVEAKSTVIGDTYYGPVICSFTKCVLQLAGQGDFRFLDGAIITHECDHMRRLYDTWRMASRDIENILPGFFHYYGLLHKDVDYSRKWFREETMILISAIEDYFGVSITDDDLNKSIALYNDFRSLLQKFDSLRKEDGMCISGADAASVVIAASAMPKEEFIPLVSTLIEELESSRQDTGSRKRLLLAGSVIDDLDFIRLIEDAGSVVVADSLCFGSRCYTDMVESSNDPVEALADRYLSHACCPRMYGKYNERLKFITDKVETYDADGVILENIRFCDMHGADNGLMVRDLEKEGIPVLSIEREYGPLVETGRIRMRVDAFLERIH